ncbi:MAG: CocE/NonD family hydrolase [Pirellulales bacterium]
MRAPLALLTCHFLAVLLMGHPLHAIEPAYPVRIDRHVRIPMRDGLTLSADLIRPDEEGEFPVVVEYHPYRKDDVSRGGHDVHWYLAERGFIGVRLDVRGTGGSDGINTDEYVRQEQEDGYDAVEWLAEQGFCNGCVGMFGTSYGGFTCLQVAMNRPPHLKAIVPMYATDDRYSDDCHYSPGGNMRMYYDVGTYGGNMVAMNALPPLPELAGPGWAEQWKQRLEKNEPYLLKWMHHQTDGPYWRGASLRPDYARIECPTYLIAGWRDGYVNAMLRTHDKLACPKKLLIGPWVHNRPNTSTPGPRVDYIHEMAEFFDATLRKVPRELPGPPVKVYMQHYAPPRRTIEETPGVWRDSHTLASRGDTQRTFLLASNGQLVPPGEKRTAPGSIEFRYEPTVGVQNGYWSAGGISFYLADDQRADEAHSLVFTTEPFDNDVPLLGWPEVVLHASSSAPVATFVAKLADVAPDGQSALITDGSLNGTRRNSLSKPADMQPGEVYELNIPMQPTGWVIPAGHRLRLAISGSDFPNLWPTPLATTNRIYHGGLRVSRVTLPIAGDTELAATGFAPPPALMRFGASYGEPAAQQTIVDQIAGTVTIFNRRAGRTVLEDNLGTLSSESSFRCAASTSNPAQASIVGTHRYSIEREDGRYDVTGESSIRATADTFHIVIDLTVTRNGRPFFQKQWTASEPRNKL